jgi:hypothetical protein
MDFQCSVSKFVRHQVWFLMEGYVAQTLKEIRGQAADI